jgi:hypothetical protein
MHDFLLFLETNWGWLWPIPLIFYWETQGGIRRAFRGWSAYRLKMMTEKTKQLEVQAELYHQSRGISLKSESYYTTAQVLEDGWQEMPYPPYVRGMQQQQGEE